MALYRHTKYLLHAAFVSKLGRKLSQMRAWSLIHNEKPIAFFEITAM
jgi:hypothetical protein